MSRQVYNLNKDKTHKMLNLLPAKIILTLTTIYFQLKYLSGPLLCIILCSDYTEFQQALGIEIIIIYFWKQNIC